jgi:predicted dienelactone hydrolase
MIRAVVFLSIIVSTAASVRAASTQSRATAPVLPQPTGSFAVGRIDFHWIDQSRPEPHASGPDARRELMVHVWYPAAHMDGQTPTRMPYIQHFAAVQRVVAREVLENLFRPSSYSRLEAEGLPESSAIPGAGMPPAPERWPVLIFSHGLGNPTALYTAALQDLASHGFVVAAIDHTFDNAFTVISESRIVPYAREAWSKASAEPGGVVAYVRARIEEMWAPDIRFVIDQLTRDDRTRFLAAPFSGRLDLQRLGAIGHSVGGLAAVRACQLDPRIRACANQDADVAGSPFVTRASDQHLNVPLLFFTAATANVFKQGFVHPSDEDLTKMKRTRAQYEADVKRVQTTQRDALVSVAAPSYRVQIDRPSFVHRSFSDLTLIAEHYEPAQRYEARRDFEIAQHYVRAFFDKHLRGARETVLEREVAPFPGVRLDRFGVQP